MKNWCLPWTEEQDQQIVELAKAKKSREEICEILGRSIKGLEQHITQLRKKGIEIPIIYSNRWKNRTCWSPNHIPKTREEILTAARIRSQLNRDRKKALKCQ